MNVTVYNSRVEIADPSQELISWAESTLTYTDKSKQYQLKRMAKSPWLANSQNYLDLKSKVQGSLYTLEGNTMYMPQGFLQMLIARFPTAQITDNRHDTGRKVVLPWANKPHSPREYQEEAIDILLSPDKYRSVVNFATGLGKTLTALHLLQRYKRNTLIICPSDSIAKQFYEQCESAFGKQKVEFFGGGRKKIADITVGIAASITRNIKTLADADFGLVIFDEIHHIAADTFYNIAEGLSGVGKIIGLTATDYRSDGKDIMITAGCGPVVVRRDIKWGVENGYLAKPYFLVREIPTEGEDYPDNKLKCYKAHVLNNQMMKDQIFSDAKKMMDAGKSVLVLVDEVEHGKELSKQLGTPLAIGDDSNSQNYVSQLNAGKISGLVGTDGRIGEGTDTKNVDVLILANFVASKGPVIQAVGRGLRKTDTKDKCLVLDYVPLGSSMLTRHARGRIEFYREITDKVKVIESD